MIIGKCLNAKHSSAVTARQDLEVGEITEKCEADLQLLQHTTEQGSNRTCEAAAAKYFSMLYMRIIRSIQHLLVSSKQRQLADTA